MITKEKNLSRSIRLLCACGMLAGLATAQAQKVEVVQITGTRITTPGVTSNSPILSVSAEEMNASQPVAVEEFFKFLPSAVPAIGPGVNNGSGGGATIDLRGLNPNRTLVLVNGRRLVPFNLLGAVDTNSVPIALINRVDLVTGGASVVYGADAVAGVVNFNLKRNFTGVDLSTSYGMTSSEHDTKRRRTDLTIGANLADNRGNVVLSVGKTSSDPLRQGERARSITSILSTTGLAGGSGTTIPSAFSIGQVTGGSAALSGAVQIDPASGRLVAPVVAYNTNPLNYFQTGLERTQATALANFKINDYAQAYAEVFYTASAVSATLAESGTFANVYNVPIGNPFIPEPARQQICARRLIPAASCVAGNATVVPMTVNRRFTELGPRFNNFDNKTLQYTVGVKGDLAYSWNYDAYWSRGNADQTQTRLNWGSNAKVQQALNALTPGTCVVATNGCVPLNVFGAAGSITPEMLAYINQSALLLQKVQQDVGALTLSGDLGGKLVSPFAGEPISMSLLAEQRKLRAGTQSDAASQIANEVLGTGAATPDRSGTFQMREYALEAVLPLVKDKPFMRKISMEVGYRQTTFETAKGSEDYGSWKAGAEWEPLKMLRFRGMVQKATRAPNINELFAPPVTGLSNLALDPCAGGAINKAEANTAGTLSNLCRLTGVPLSEIGSLQVPSSNQINNLTSGNPALGPEEAKTKTIGFVIEPVARMSISLDYYKIAIEKAISSLSTTDVVDGCYQKANNPGYALLPGCLTLGRNTVNGTFSGGASRGVETPQSNLGTQSTSGIDLSVLYRVLARDVGLDPELGKLDLGFALNQIHSYRAQPTPSSKDRDCLGYYSTACGQLSYKRKFSQRGTWSVGPVSLGYNWRYVSAVQAEPSATVFIPEYTHIDAYNYVDFSALWNVTKNLRINVAINNLADKKAPFVGSSVGSTTYNAGNTFPTFYDAVGRYITFGATLKF